MDPERQDLLEEILDDYLRELSPQDKARLSTWTTADLMLMLRACHWIAEDWFVRGQKHAASRPKAGGEGEP